MTNKITRIKYSFPEKMILSKFWGKSRLNSFFHNMEKKTIFGYSAAFTLEEVEELAREYGVKVEVLPKSNPLQKKYGDFVLRVSQSYVDPKSTPIRIPFDDVYCLTRKISLGNRKCKGHNCPNIIYKGEEFLEIANLIELHTGRKAYDKKSLCRDCAKSFIKNKIIRLLRALCSSTSAIDSVIKAVNKL